jgi:hypothetical protein
MATRSCLRLAKKSDLNSDLHIHAIAPARKKKPIALAMLPKVEKEKERKKPNLQARPLTNN